MNKSKYLFPLILAVVAAVMTFLYSENKPEIKENNHSTKIQINNKIKDINNLTDEDIRLLPGLTATLG
jgi:hypothetical protein